ISHTCGKLLLSALPHLQFAGAKGLKTLSDLGIQAPSTAAIRVNLIRMLVRSRFRVIVEAAASLLCVLPLIPRDQVQMNDINELDLIAIREYRNRSATLSIASGVTAYYLRVPWSDLELVQSIQAVTG